ncbi:hypothetical protein IFM89_013543 [Coptis chinensis]|uniref:Uncharacterized protein n=1 Tax=Coptis chinensis TaxID=261450 RepID=A0A835HSN7_9MAGN|nr:hypothetical protein IFM89_013543 [Coptis chinensis]
MDPEENFNPNTEVDETLDSDMDPEENFNSNTEVDETPDSNMEENVTQRTGEKRKGRGAVVCSRLTKMKENERVDVVFNQNGQRIGEGGKDLASYSGLLAASRVSIATYGNWHDVKGEARDRLWKFIKGNSTWKTTKMKGTLQDIGEKWREFKSSDPGSTSHHLKTNSNCLENLPNI